MAARRAAARKSLREVYADNNSADRFYAAMSGKPAANQVEVKAKRVMTQRTADEDKEEAVMAEVADVIRLCPSVVISWRPNSGSLPDSRGVPIWFYRKIKGMDDMTISDYLCLKKNGQLIALECKWRGWNYTGTPREKEQDAFIQAVRATGGRGGFVTCAEQALEILK